VYEVNPDSAAEHAGIQINDVIVSINGTRLRDSGSLRNSIGLLPPGEKVVVGFLRDGREQTLTAVLGELPSTAVASTTPRAQKDEANLDGIFEGAEIVDNSNGGLLVARVDPNSPAADRGLQPGDVITKVNRVPIHTLAEAVPIMQNARAILLEVQRRGRSSLILMR
jgi:S1-C subfamily serine protease